MSGGGKGGSVTVGYRYFLGMHMALCHGPIDKILSVQVDGRVAWTGTSTGGSITVNAPDLFGGDKREGGVSGVVDFEFGEPLQGANSYLTSVLPGENPAYRGVACAVLNQCYMGNNPYLKPWSFTAQRVFVSTDGVEQWNLENAGITKGAATVTGVPDYVYNLATDDPVLANHEAPFGLNNPDAELRVRVYSSGAFQSYTWPTATTSNVLSSTARTLDVGDCHPPIERLVTWNGTAASLARYLQAPPFNGSGAIKMVYMGGTLDASSNNMTLIQVPVRFSYTRTNDPSLKYYQNGASIYFDQFNTADGVKIELRLSAPTVPVTNILLADFGVNGDSPFRLDQPYEMTAYLKNSGPFSVFEPNPPFRGFYRIHVPWEWGVKIRNPSGEYLLDISGATPSGTNSGWYDYGEGNMAGYTYLPEVNPYTSYFLFGGDRIDLLHLSGVAGYTPVTIFGDNPPSYFDCGGDCPDMNPAHIIRECLTQPWGLGYQSADIDDTSFTAAATALHSEGMGISILWDKEVPIEDFVSEILRHIDGVLYVSRTTGKFVLKLIRDDYDEASLITLDETNARMASDARRPAVGELVTSVTVNFTDSEQDEEEGSVTVHNEALIQLQGAVNNATVNYPGFMTRSLASRVALRDLRTLSTPLLSCDVEANRQAAALNIGDVFLLNYPEQGIYNLVMRIESMSVGDGRDNTVKISCIEDAFSIPDFDVVGDPGTGWVDPVNGIPEESRPRLMIESPYYELVQRVGDREAGLILDDEPDAGFIHANGGRQGGELNADLMVSSGGGFVDSGVLDFAPYAYLSADAWYTDSKLYYTNGKDLDTVTFPALAQVGEEIIRVDSLGVDSNGAHFNVGRGVLDTVPAEHTIDLPVVFFAPATDNLQYTASDTVNIQLLTTLGSQRLSSDDATIDTITFDSRAIRPYPPGNFEIDFESYPRTLEWDGMHSLSWAHRDRLQQTSGTIFDNDDGDIGPEPGVSYVVTGTAFVGESTKSALRINGAYSWVEGDVDFEFGSDDFCIEFSIYFDSLIEELNYWWIIGQKVLAYPQSDADWQIIYRYIPPIGAQFLFQSGAINLPSRLAPNVWHHIRFVRKLSGETRRIFCYINGVRVDSVAVFPTTVAASSEPIRIGNPGNSNYMSWENTQTGANNDDPWYGYVSNLRITTGTSRITAESVFPFTPQSSYELEFPFPEIACDSSGVTPCDEHLESVVTLNTFDGSADNDVISGNTWTLENASIGNTPPSTAELEEVIFIDVNVGTDTEYDIDFGSSEIDSSYAGPPLNTRYVTLSVKSVRDGYDSWQAPSVTLTVPEEIDSIGIDSIGIDSQPDSSPSGDPYFANVSLLLHMDGADGSTTFTDSSSNALTGTAVGDAQIDTAQSKFGGASGLFQASSDYVTYPDDASLQLGTGLFTIEGFVRIVAHRGGTKYPSIVQYRGDSKFNWVFGFDPTGKFNTNSSTAGGALTYYMAVSPSALALNTWAHFALVRQGSGATDIKLYVDGVLTQSSSSNPDFDAYSPSNPNLKLYIGGVSEDTFNGSINGWLDDIRITKGVARYTAAFTPPSAPFPDE